MDDKIYLKVDRRLVVRRIKECSYLLSKSIGVPLEVELLDQITKDLDRLIATIEIYQDQDDDS